MQTTIKKTDAKIKRDKIPKDDSPKSQDEILKKTSYNVTTPRNYVQKTTTADIYGQKKRAPSLSAKAPKKSLNTSVNNSSPMKDLLRSTSSTTSVASSITASEKSRIIRKKLDEKSTNKSTKDFNVTVNSPAVKRKLNLDKERSFIKDVSRKDDSKKHVVSKERSLIKDVSRKDESKKHGVSKAESQKTAKTDGERQRTKTRTLNENEVKILTPEAVDNNAEMLNLSRKLSAKPKAFFIDLEASKATQIEKKSQLRPRTPSDEEISYEDDFESYESDFDSYHSSSPSEQNGSDEKSVGDDGDEDDHGDDGTVEPETRELKDEEKMLDSGNFDLRDQRSATMTKPALGFILETAEGHEDKPSSLTDEGFQEMSSSSAVSSIRTVHVDILDRPLFIDFSRSKENKRKKRINDKLRQRAKDLLSVITLHEMSYSLFEMKPISYDLYMATFGRSNYKQIAVQTYDDGITEEVQTEEIDFEHKWTQHPIEFSKNDVCFNTKVERRKYCQNIEDYLTKFTFLTTQSLDVQQNNEINLNENYKTNPLRIYFEQKDGAGPSEMLPYEKYKSKLKNNEYNSQRLGKFLKKMEGTVCNILNSNSGDSELSELKITKLPFSKGYVSISTKSLNDEKYSFLTKTKISQVYISETKNNLIMTVQNKSQTAGKCTICLWDIGVARREPVKVLTAIDSVAIGRFRGATDGIFVAALVDGSIHLWDLSEQPMWRPDVATVEKSDKIVEVNEKDLTPVEQDRKWNHQNSHVGLKESIVDYPLQACAFTNSASNMNSGDAASSVVGLEFSGELTVTREGRRIVGQIVALQRTGILAIWLIIQEKSKTVPPDIGKAFWSKMKLERNQTIFLLDHIDIPLKDTPNFDFNLNAAKRRLQNRKQEKNIIKSTFRPKSSTDRFDSDRPSSVASVKNKKMLPVSNVSVNWESGIVCYDLKVVFWGNSDSYLVAKNCGEVLCCKRTLGVVRVSRFCVTTDASSITCLEVSPHKLPYYLAASDAGTISVCSLLENRVLLTLDCRDTLAAIRCILYLRQEYSKSCCTRNDERNIPSQELEKCQSDHKGRFVSTTANKSYSASDVRVADKLFISSVSWSHINPCCIFAAIDSSIVSWHLSHSDIYAKSASDNAAIACVAGDTVLALLTPDGEVHVHKLTNEQKTKEFLLLFEKYVALL